MSYTSQNRLPMLPRRRTARPAGVIRITPSFLEAFEKTFAIIVVILFSGGFIRTIFGDLSEESASKGLFYMTTMTLYSGAACLLLVAVFYRRLRIKVPVALVLLLALAGVSALWSADPKWVLFKWTALLGTYIIGIYFAVRFSLREFVGILWWAFTIMAIASFVYLFLLPQIGITIGVTHSDGRPMPRGIFSQKNGLGNNMVLAVITYIVVHFDRAALGRNFRRFNLAMLFLAGFLLVFSGSATALVLVPVAAACLIYVAFIRRMGLISAPLLLFGIWIAAMLLWTIVSDPGTFAELVGRDETLSGRTKTWQLAILLIEQEPLLGYGYATDVFATVSKWVHVHNGFFWLTLQLGLIGCTLLLAVLAQTGWRCYAAAKRSPDFLALWPLVILVVIVARNLTEVALMGSNSLVWCLLIYFASSEALARWGPPEES